MNRFLVAATAALLVAAGGVHAAGIPDAEVDNAAVRVSPTEQALRVDGVIGPRFEADVRRALDANPAVRRLIVTGPGGMRAQALRVAELANARGLTVRVAGRCASACALLWAASKSREMTYDAGIGLHRSGLDPSLGLPEGVRAMLMARNDRQTDDVLRQAGFPERVIAAGASTPATSMSWFSPYELRTGGVPFDLVDAAGRTASLDRRTGRVVGATVSR
ncbi:hypothetical protein [Cognatilysobacter segetis]|uniref:hypothetical protein n=1 Tax=Cognatilysobacter segetis TaxID=2492394 RepID=UPI00105BB8CC|nr:hypothetical protein [Lysobacter segetis]